MKGLIFTLAILFSQASFAQIRSIDLVGTFENDQGCRVYGAHCYSLDINNPCRFEVYKDGEYVVSLGKGAKLESFNEKVIIAKDFGLRSGHGIPTYVNKSARFDILDSFKDPYSYTDRTVVKFNLIVKSGMLNREVISCKNLSLVQEN